MCGIIHVKRKDNRPAYKTVLKRYANQKSRGKEGFGYVAIKNGKVVSYKRSPIEHEIIKMLRHEDAPEILFHHRFPTSTPNIEESAHPLMIVSDKLNYNYFVAHNGVIRNDNELKEKHYKDGWKYSTFLEKVILTPGGKQYAMGGEWNDSESLAVETALVLDGKKKEIDTEGAAAVIGLKMDGDRVVERFFFHNIGNPLVYFEDNNLTIISSEGKGEDVKTLSVFRLKDKEGFEEMPGDLSAPMMHKAYKYPGNYNGYHGGMYEDNYRRDDYKFEHYRTRAISRAPALSAIEAIDAKKQIEQMGLDSLWQKYDETIASIEEYEADIEVAKVIHATDPEDHALLQESIDLGDALAKLADIRVMLEAEIDVRGLSTFSR